MDKFHIVFGKNVLNEVKMNPKKNITNINSTKSRTTLFSNVLKHCKQNQDFIESTKFKKIASMEEYQIKPYEILKENSNKGLLLAYQTGSGKTVTACFTAIQLLINKIVEKVFIVLPNNVLLNCNFQYDFIRLFIYLNNQLKLFDINNIIKGEDSIYTMYLKCFDISTDNSICFLKHDEIKKLYEKNNTNSSILRYIPNSLLIIDEAHHMCNLKNLKNKSISDTLTISNTLTMLAFHSKKVLLLTATPYRNSYEDFLAYYLSLTNFNQKSPNFEELFKSYKNYFKTITDVGNLLKNFKNKILYVKNQGKDFAKIVYVNGEFQESKDFIINDKIQCIKYNVIENLDQAKEILDIADSSDSDDSDDSDNELETVAESYATTDNIFINNIDVTSANHFKRTIITNDLFNKFIHNIKYYQHKSEEKNESAKWFDPFPLLIYSTFISDGIDKFENFLTDLQDEKFNFVIYGSTSVKDSDHSTSSQNKNKRTIIFAKISGKTDKNKNFEIIQNFNAGKIDMILLSDVVSEGLNFTGTYGVKQIHFFNLKWNYVSIEQIVGRGWRKGAHSLIPEEYRKIRIFVYLTQIHVAEGPIIKKFNESKKLYEHLEQKFGSHSNEN